MQEFVDKGEIAGIVTLVANKEKVLYLNTVGTSDLSRKMKTDDLFWIASMTKPMTAVCAGMLVDEGKIAWDDPVEKYIPEFRQLKVGQEGAALQRPITVRDLLTHTSGLPEYSKTDGHWTLEQFSRQIATQPLRFQPGTRWLYSTAGIDAVGRVVEVASGMPFDQFMQKRLFDPLEMKNTNWWITPENEARYANTYRLNPQTNKLEPAPISYMRGTPVSDRQRPPLGGAGLFSTAEDIGRFYQMLLNGGVWEGKVIIKPETLAAVTKNQIGTITARAGEPWGYGFAVVQDPSKQPANVMLPAGAYGHGGAYGTNSWLDPKRGVVYVIMLERSGFRDVDNNPMRVAFQQMAADALDK